MKASLSSPLAVAVAAVLAVAASSGALRAAEATIQSTCADAAARDRRVNVAFCARQFASYQGAAEADPWGLAKAAAVVGINVADDAVFDIGAGKIRAGAAAKATLAACSKSYDSVGMAFAEASVELAGRRYLGAKERFARVAALTQQCDGGLARAGTKTPPALAKYGADCLQMAIIGTAITDLIK